MANQQRRRSGRGLTLLAAGLLAVATQGAMVQAGEPGSGLAEAIQASDLIVVARVIGLIDTKPAARARKAREAHWIEVRRTLKGPEESGQRFLALPNGLAWVDGDSYVLFLKRIRADQVAALPERLLEATDVTISEVVSEVNAQGGEVSARRAIWMRYEGSWGAGLIAELVVTTEGEVQWKRRRGEGEERSQYEELVGTSSAEEIEALIRQIEAAGPGPIVDDAGSLTVRWIGGDGRARVKAFLMPQKPPSVELLEAAEALARAAAQAK